MGLLDDAIREHIELKRLRGADPSEVARQEQDALGPVSRSRASDAQETEENSQDAEHQGEDEQPLAYEDAAAVSSPFPAPSQEDSSAGSGFENVGQETAELDMRTVLDEQAPAAQPDHDEPADAPGEEEPVEDVLEETPEFLRDTPEQERLWFEQQPPRDFDFDK